MFYDPVGFKGLPLKVRFMGSQQLTKKETLLCVATSRASPEKE